jgi:carotenoid cleavage dioxygenase-like enzyme
MVHGIWPWDHVQHVVISAAGQVTAATDMAPGWVFHTLNADDDDGGKVVIDLCQYPDEFDVATLWTGHGPVTLDRWIVDPAAGKVTQQRLNDRGQEFPRVDERVVSRRHRFGYSAVIGEVSRATVSRPGDFADQAFANALLKHDVERGTVQAHQFGAADVVILAAQDFTAAPVARVHLPARIPLGFHGSCIADR